MRGAVVLFIVGCSAPGVEVTVGFGAPDGQGSAPTTGPVGGTSASCASLSPTCGATGNESCCAAAAVPGGTFFRSYDPAGDNNSGMPNAPATVSSFKLDTYEVTVGRFRAFVAAGGGTQAAPPAVGSGARPNLPGSGWDASWNASLSVDSAALAAGVGCSPGFATWTDAPGANENRPMNCLTWFEAFAFCAWDGGHLPTEAEWNYAAAGGDEQRVYPWSSPAASLAIDGAHASYAVYDVVAGGPSCTGDGQPGCAPADLSSVGSKPSGRARWGHADMAGNVWEWSLDWSLDDLHSPTGYPAGDCLDCANLAPGRRRVIRGGSFAAWDVSQRTSLHHAIDPSYRDNSIGVRCAR